MALVEGVDIGEGRLAEEALSYRQSAFGEIRPMAHPLRHLPDTIDPSPSYIPRHRIFVLASDKLE